MNLSINEDETPGQVADAVDSIRAAIAVTLDSEWESEISLGWLSQGVPCQVLIGGPESTTTL